MPNLPISRSATLFALLLAAPLGTASAQSADDCIARSRFAEGPLGNRGNWTERNEGRWCVMRRGEQRRYALHRTGFGVREGGRLGEHSVFRDPHGDVELTARARTLEDVRANPNAEYALILGWQNAANYDMALFHGDPARCGIYAVRDGTRSRLSSCLAPIGLDERFHRVSFRRRTLTDGGAWLEMTFAGMVVAYASDTESPLGPGKVGFGSMNDSAMFDDPVITENAPPTLSGDDAGTPADAGTPDAPSADAGRASAEDAGVPVSAVDGGVAARDAGRAPPAAEAPQPAGCSVGAGGRRPPLAPIVALAFAVALAVRRRRTSAQWRGQSSSRETRESGGTPAAIWTARGTR